METSQYAKAAEWYTEFSCTYHPASIINSFSALFTETKTTSMIYYRYDLFKKHYAKSHAEKSSWPYIKKVFSVKILEILKK